MMRIPWIKKAVDFFRKKEVKQVSNQPTIKEHVLPPPDIPKKKRRTGTRSVKGAFGKCRYKIDPARALQPQQMKRTI
jgi:hypothetical protein